MRVYRTACLLIGVLLVIGGFAAADEPLMDWSAWKKYRKTVKHPTGYINAQDLKNARENIKRYEWAKEFAKEAEAQVIPHLDRFTPEFLKQIIPANTVQRCWQCPACRDKGLPSHPGGAWTWSINDPEHIKCKLCGTVFPNDKYPETVVLRCKSKWGKGQTFSYYGGKTFKQWRYLYSRPSFSGMVRRFKVKWSNGMAYRFALAYALTEKPRYAEVVRKILLRFAEVYPNYLLVSDYGEIADMDPHIAGLRLGNLPEDELVYPPNKPDRKLYAGYWQTSRVGMGGGDGAAFTRPMLLAYEFTYNAKKADGSGLYTEQERIRIERDVILESCVHLIGNKTINNKSVFNRSAVGMVGMSLGHPGLARFGLEGWNLTMDKWFLADGCTPESPVYALMSLRGIYPFPQAVRGYSDPPGYVDKDGKRIKGLNLYEGKYKLVWQRMFEGLQGNLYYPPYADSYRTSRIPTRYVELLAANYPNNLQFLALLKEYAGDDLSKGHAETALFFRKPGLEKKKAPPLHFEDNFFPALCLGQLRTGGHGRKSLTLLSATHYGGHHHYDSLNLYYWKDGHELLTDLGYLWDHPMHKMIKRTFAHNTGMVDLKNQNKRGRGGRFGLFHTGERVKVMEASSQAYDKADIFGRTVVQIDYGEDNSYIVDLFRLRADGSRDLVYHGPNNDYKVSGINLREGDVAAEGKKGIRFGLRFHVSGKTDEIYVDDVSITLTDGVEVAVNPSAAQLDKKGKPTGWNRYGAAEWGAASPGRNDKYCAYLKATQKGKGKGVNYALIQGDTHGYTGPNALQMPEGSKGKVSFWIRGSAARCSVAFVTWPTDPNSISDREYVGLASVPVTDKWVRHTADFSLKQGGIDMKNIKSAPSPAAWSIRWKMAEDMQFSAYHCGQKGEVTYIGDGWGQRDHRNSDLGVTIPYIVRRHRPKAKAGISTFCTIYEAHKPDAGLVKSVRRPAVPGQYADNVVVLEIKTKVGTDLVISQLVPARVELETPLGKVRTDARVTVISVRDGKAATASLAEGNTATLNGAKLVTERLKVNKALAEQAPRLD